MCWPPFIMHCLIVVEYTDFQPVHILDAGFALIQQSVM